jgi:hypothetical protein
LAVDEEGVTLSVTVVVEVAGKRFAVEPQTVRQGLQGEAACDELKVGQTEDSNVVIGGKRLPCRKIGFECITGGNSSSTTVYYSDSVSPHVLKRETVVTQRGADQPTSETTFEVTGLELPWRVLTEIKSTAFARTVSKHAKGSKTTWSVLSSDVPGGVVAHSSKEVDGNDRLVRRSTLELIDYGLEAESTQAGVLGRRRPALFHKSKPAPHYRPR